METPPWACRRAASAHSTLPTGVTALSGRSGTTLPSCPPGGLQRRADDPVSAGANGWSRPLAAVSGAVVGLSLARRAVRRAARQGQLRRRQKRKRVSVACRGSSYIAADELAEELFEEVKSDNYTEEDLLEDDDRGGAAAQSARGQQEVEQLFREGSGGGDALSFEGVAGISEIAGLLADGDLTMEELRQMWAETPKEGGAVDIAGFGALLARIDELFEQVDEEATTRYIVTPETLISELTRSSVRKAIRNGEWKLRLENAGGGVKVRPMPQLPGGGENPLFALGECGETVRLLNRARSGGERFRPEFIDFCARTILERVDCSDGIIYSSVGCGSLYFDWEMLERLVHVEGVRVKEAWLVEPFGMEFAETKTARSVFADWFSDVGIDVRAFHSLDVLTDWIRVLPSGDQAHVLMEVDTESIADGVAQHSILRPGGLHLTLTQEFDDFGRPRAVRQVYQKGLEAPQRVRPLESKVTEDGSSWADRKA